MIEFNKNPEAVLSLLRKIKSMKGKKEVKKTPETNKIQNLVEEQIKGKEGYVIDIIELPNGDEEIYVTISCPDESNVSCSVEVRFDKDQVNQGLKAFIDVVQGIESLRELVRESNRAREKLKTKKP